MDGEAPVLVIACGALAREIVALKKLNGWSALDIQCRPAVQTLERDDLAGEGAARDDQDGRCTVHRTVSAPRRQRSPSAAPR